MKFDFKGLTKQVPLTLADLGGVTVGAIVGNQFMDLQRIFKTANPEGMFIKHQGGWKALGAVAALSLWKEKANEDFLMRLLRMGILGIGVGGAIKQVRVWTDKVETIGTSNQSSVGAGADTSALDRLLQEAANSSNTSGPYDDPSSGVGGPPAIPQMDYGSTVGFVSPWQGGF
jgi:hypothetical protein